MSVEECPNCGAPMRDGKCNYCQASELGKNIWNEGKCRNCGAGLKNNLIKDNQNRFVCRYCGWPVTEKPIEDTLRSPSTPLDTEPLPPGSPVAQIQSSSSSEGGLGMYIGIMFGIMFGLVLTIFIVTALINPLAKLGASVSPNITSTNHTVDIPSYTPGSSVMLIGMAFVAGIALTFLILRNRHKRELARQQRLIGGNQH